MNTQQILKKIVLIDTSSQEKTYELYYCPLKHMLKNFLAHTERTKKKRGKCYSLVSSFHKIIVPRKIG